MCKCTVKRSWDVQMHWGPANFAAVHYRARAVAGVRRLAYVLMVPVQLGLPGNVISHSGSMRGTFKD